MRQGKKNTTEMGRIWDVKLKKYLALHKESITNFASKCKLTTHEIYLAIYCKAPIHVATAICTATKGLVPSAHTTGFHDKRHPIKTKATLEIPARLWNHKRLSADACLLYARLRSLACNREHMLCIDINELANDMGYILDRLEVAIFDLSKEKFLRVDREDDPMKVKFTIHE